MVVCLISPLVLCRFGEGIQLEMVPNIPYWVHTFMTDRWAGVAAAVMQTLPVCFCEENWAQRARFLFTNYSVYPNKNSEIRAGGVAGLSLRDRLGNSPIQKRLESLLLHINRSWLRWYGPLFSIPPWKVFFCHVQPGRDPGPYSDHAGELTSLSWLGTASVFIRAGGDDRVEGNRNCFTQTVDLIDASFL